MIPEEKNARLPHPEESDRLKGLKRVSAGPASQPISATEQQIKVKIEDDQIQTQVDPNLISPVSSDSPEDQAIIADDTFWFDVPTHYIDNPKKYIPDKEQCDVILDQVPAIVSDAILSVMQENIPIGAYNVFDQLMTEQLLPNFVVIWFIRQQYYKTDFAVTRFTSRF